MWYASLSLSINGILSCIENTIGFILMGQSTCSTHVAVSISTEPDVQDTKSELAILTKHSGTAFFIV